MIFTQIIIYFISETLIILENYENTKSHMKEIDD